MSQDLLCQDPKAEDLIDRTIGSLYWSNNLSFSVGFNSNLYRQLNRTIAPPLPNASYTDLLSGLKEVQRLQMLNPEIAGSGGVVLGVM